MRLINLFSYEFRSFYGSEIPHYAILSHCWGSQEVSYDQFWKQRASFTEFSQHIQRVWMGKSVNLSSGYDKIVAFCKHARERPARVWREATMDVREMWLEWGWIDTCCIDIRSSAELSEAIQSMYPFYEYAAVCYAYLADVPAGETADSPSFRESRWFQRGWTLQELLAPWDVIVCNEQWELLGHKCTHQVDLQGCCTLPSHLKQQFGASLNPTIAAASGIAVGYLRSPRAPLDASIACRMSWAAYRSTKRVEDQAYCLLGLFDINMPMLYGEGRKAFLRLQEHLVNISNDASIFAWNQRLPGAVETMLAPSPSDFAGCNGVHRIVGETRAAFRLAKEHLMYHGPAAKYNEQVYVIRVGCRSADGSPIEVAVSSSSTANQHEFQRLYSDSGAATRARTKRTVADIVPRSERSAERIETLYLNASGPVIGPRLVRQLCHELEAAPLSELETACSQEAILRFMRGSEFEHLKQHPVWKHIGPVWEAAAAASVLSRPPTTGECKSGPNAPGHERCDAILQNAQRLAVAAMSLPAPGAGDRRS